MLYKYNKKHLEQEIYAMNSSGYAKVTNYDQKNNCLEVLLYDIETKYEINFYMDISPLNNNFQKRNSKIKTPGIYTNNQLNLLISQFNQNYIPEKHSNLLDFFQLLKNYLNENLSKEELIHDNQKELSNIYTKFEKYSKCNIILISFCIHIFSIIIQIFVGRFGYSGEKTPPKFGDFEAQRHWMELTIFLPMGEWYTNSRLNRKDYWPLDYPPMSGYHSYLLGKILEKYYPESVTFKKSLGYESAKFKIIMRLFVIISDFIFFHVGVNVLCYYIFIYSKIKKGKKPQVMNYYIILFLILSNPLMIIIDHGHFQFNNVMHGLFIISLFFLYTDNYILAIIFFSFCVNFKQMGLYYAIPFPLYVIKKLFFENKNNYNIIISLIYVIIYTIITLLVNIIIYLPWLKEQKINDVFSRIFPVERGIFEDKVATFWCVLNIFYKINKKLSINNLIKLAFLLTLIGCSLPIYSLFKIRNLNYKICSLCFFVVSFSFYLFSFHVHEKTIIVPFLAYLINLPNMKNILPSFTLIGIFSLFPLLKRENQIIPYYFTIVTFYLICKQGMKLLNIKKKNKENISIKNNEENMFLLLEICIFFIMIFYHFVDYNIPPPKKYPWFYPMINATFCFLFFFGIFLYSNYKLIVIVSEKNSKDEKLKEKIY